MRATITANARRHETQIVQWCGDPQHYLVVPHVDRERAVLVPILGEAA